MKLATKVNEFHTNNVKESVGYRVANSIHTMEILSGLYSDELKACIRELSTNAYDAQMEAGNGDKPFKIELPTTNNPIFSIRDYGTGLSPEKMKDVYTVYGVSDKTTSNDFDGCLGLGSKSPFTYCKMFTTISYYNGMKYVAVNAHNERGRPTFNILHSEPTDEPNGLEVRFDIKESDIYTFIEKASSVYQWFAVLPEVVDKNQDDELKAVINGLRTSKENNIAFSQDGWKVLKSGFSSCVVMGNIAYPLESMHFDSQHAGLIRNGLILYVNRGEVDFTPSRESLKYTPYTVANISNYLTDILAYIKDNLEQEFEDCEYLWDATIKLNTLRNGPMGRLFDLVTPDTKFQGKDLEAKTYIDEGCDRFVLFKKVYGKIKQSSHNCIYYKDTTKFVVCDLKNKGFAALRRHMEQTSFNGSYHLYCVDGDTHKDGIKFVSDTYGVNPDTILLCSSFPKPVKNSKGKIVSNTLFQCQQLRDITRVYNKRGYWNSYEVDMNNGTYYYVIIGKSYELINSDRYSHTVANVVKIARNMKISTDNIIGLTKKRYEKIKNKKNWKNFFDEAKKYVDKFCSNSNNVKSIEAYLNNDEYLTYKNLMPFLNKTTKLYKFLSKFEKLDIKNGSIISEIISDYEAASGKRYELPVVNFSINTDFINETYPMLALIDSHRFINGSIYRPASKESLKVISDYVNSIS